MAEGWFQAAQDWLGKLSLDPGNNKSGENGREAPQSNRRSNTPPPQSPNAPRQQQNGYHADNLHEPGTSGMGPGEWGPDSNRQPFPSARSSGVRQSGTASSHATTSISGRDRNSVRAKPVVHDGMPIQERIEILEAMNTALVRHIHEMAWEADVSFYERYRTIFSSTPDDKFHGYGFIFCACLLKILFFFFEQAC
jgi:hypothetical protein